MTTPCRFKSTIMLGAVVVTAGAALVVPSAAQAASTRTATTETGTRELPARYRRACLRIPNLQLRTETLIARLNGDASTLGSLLWLQAQIDDAKAKWVVGCQCRYHHCAGADSDTTARFRRHGAGNERSS